ncbi:MULTISPECIES: FlgD immunoglobulin-like domain containing protein [unclassified Nocardioides]|uniref:FlgD immunoglobulin-like domain containing protein n=1 Tax=unclassified Nocardioides TaxID=2615069 RepID=UPI0007018083|nr:MULTISPECIES: FlgD immunoglobulin-like domain containing protein [unclassified Nocardioides]KQY56725.1 hypothetical protein ASD30_10450 [Nocardioides sp. Root140]KRF12847.1 hypothetical protein ASH02_15095 [Nocardioides sp. Soil796]
MRAPRLFATLLTASVVGSGLVALTSAPAQAEDLNATLITPTTGDQVSGDLSIEVALTGTDNAMVTFRSGAQTRKQMIADYTNGDPVDGVARWTLPSFGLDAGTVITVAPCGTSTPSTCLSTPTDTSTLDVSNPVTWDAPTEPVFVDLRSEALPSVTVHDDGPGELNLLWANQAQGPALVRDQPRQLTASPYANVVSGELVVRRCIRDTSATFYGVCATENTSAVVTARRSLTMHLTTDSLRLLSPNGDGILDTAKVTLDTEGLPGQSATWQIETIGGEALTGPIPVELDTQGNAVITIDPIAAGVTPTTGQHRIRVTTQAVDHGHEFTADTFTSFEIDVTPPRVTSLVRQWATFYPYDDEYRDEVGLTPKVEGQVSDAKVEVLNADGAVVDTMPGLGDQGFWWDGRRQDGRTAPAGTYRFRITLTDRAWNTSVFTGAPVVLSTKRLVRRTWDRTISAQASLHLNWSGRCSSLRKPGLRRMTGSIGYYSMSRCSGSNVDDRTALALHDVRIPNAIKYHGLTIRAYGGAVKRSTGHRGTIWMLNNTDGAPLTRRALSSSLTWHSGGTANTNRMRYANGYVYWAVGTGYGQRYDVKSFRLTLEYYVLG